PPRRPVAERRHVPGWAARQLPRGLDGSGGSGPHWTLRTVERLVPGLDPLSGGVVVAVDAPPVSPRAEPCRHGGGGRGQDASGGAGLIPAAKLPHGHPDLQPRQVAVIDRHPAWSVRPALAAGSGEVRPLSVDHRGVTLL